MKAHEASRVLNPRHANMKRTCWGPPLGRFVADLREPPTRPVPGLFSEDDPAAESAALPDQEARDRYDSRANVESSRTPPAGRRQFSDVMRRAEAVGQSHFAAMTFYYFQSDVKVALAPRSCARFRLSPVGRRPGMRAAKARGCVRRCERRAVAEVTRHGGINHGVAVGRVAARARPDPSA